jgi:hypothetical protein
MTFAYVPEIKPKFFIFFQIAQIINPDINSNENSTGISGIGISGDSLHLGDPTFPAPPPDRDESIPAFPFLSLQIGRDYCVHDRGQAYRAMLVTDGNPSRLPIHLDFVEEPPHGHGLVAVLQTRDFLSIK